MNFDSQQYQEQVRRHAPRSPYKANLLHSFLIGGAICLVGQLFTEGFQVLGMDQEAAGSACCISLIFLGALLTGLGVYDDLAKLGGAGTLIPITGFANAVAAPALEFKTEGLVTGTGVKMFTIAGPVIAYGIAASVIYGLFFWLLQ